MCLTWCMLGVIRLASYMAAELLHQAWLWAPRALLLGMQLPKLSRQVETMCSFL